MHNGVSADGDGDGSPPSAQQPGGTLILVPPFTLFSNELAMGSVGRCAAVLPGLGGRGSALGDGDGVLGRGVVVLLRRSLAGSAWSMATCRRSRDRRIRSSGRARQGKARQSTARAKAKGYGVRAARQHRCPRFG